MDKKPELAPYIYAHIDKKYQWGKNDCCTFVLRWIDQRNGTNLMDQYGPWKTAREATKIINAYGGLEALFDKHFKRISPSFACDGDLTIYKKTACIFNGNGFVSVGKQGLVTIPRGAATCAWR